MTYWFTADFHLAHNGILDMESRPFKGVDEMALAFRERINERMKDNDKLVICGDIAFGRQDRLAEWLRGLRCKKRIIVAWGNHDETAQKLYRRDSSVFERVGDIVYIRWQTLLIVCCHYPLASWRKSNHGSLHVHGHCHGKLLIDPSLRRKDVGVDTSAAYAPYSLEEIVEEFKDLPLHSHH